MDSFSAWLAMGGYAAFIWAAYGVAAAVLGGLAWHSWRAHRLGEKALAGLHRRFRQRHEGRER